MNTTTRIGKIARLPHQLREQLNLRLHDHQPHKIILPWLNSLPETNAILATDFDNRPITKQNLSEWKQGGFRDWLLQYNASQFLQFTDVQSSSSSFSSSSLIPTEFPKQPAAPDSSQAHPNDLTQHATRTTNDQPHGIHVINKLLLWTQLQFTTMARFIDAETDPDRKWNALRHFANDISRLRRSTLADDYLQIQRDWLALSQSNTADKKEKDFWKWTTRPDIAKKLFPEPRRGMTAEQMYQFEKDTCLFDGPGPEIAELMAEVRIARKILELRKLQEAEAKAKSEPDYDPNRPLPDTKVRLAGMPFEELFPTIPDKPLTETHPELDDDLIENPDGHDSDDDSAPSPTSETQAQHDSHSSHRHASDEGGSDPACRAEASERRQVQPNPTKSNQGPPPIPSPTKIMTAQPTTDLSINPM